MANREVRRLTVRMLGSLPVIDDYMKRLGLVQVVDEHAPCDPSSKHTNGKVFAALVANRLTAPRPLYDVVNWAQEWAVEAVFGIPAAELNDDRLGSMLDAVVAQAEQIKGCLALQVRSAFQLPIRQVLWDLTSVSVVGEYPEGEQLAEYAKVCFGHGGAGKQIRMGMAVSLPGAIPLQHQAYDGNTNDVSTLAKVLPKLRQMMVAGEVLVLTGDSKLLSGPNITAMQAEGVRFVAPGGRREAIAADVAGLAPDDWQELSYQSERDQQAGKELGFRGAETTTLVQDKAAGKSHVLRRVLIESQEERQACRRSRARQMEAAEQRLALIARNAGNRHYPEETDIAAAVKAELKKRRVEKFYHIEVGAEGEPGRPFLRWRRNEQALAEAEKLDGIYALDSNITVGEQDTDGLLRTYKAQCHVERRIGDSKGCLRVRPVFVKSNARIVALMLVVMVALMVYSLMEYQARLKLGERRKLANLLAGHVAARPTGENLLKALAHWYVVETPEGAIPSAPNLLQEQILTLLGVAVPDGYPPSGTNNRSCEKQG